MHRRKRYSLETIPKFDDRFDELWSARPRADYVPYRTASHLNWRYELGHETSNRFSLSVAIADGGVAAFSVSHTSYGMRRIVDLGWLDDESLRAVLSFDLARAARSRLAGVDLLHLGPQEPLQQALAPLGFVAVPAIPVIAYPAKGGGPAFTDPDQWDLFEGAFDV